MNNPSKEQRLAIEAHGSNVLVNAGAGSGKTSVLSEHVLYLIKNHGYRITDFLIVTFTKAAAFEMKKRIKELLLENKNIIDDKEISDVDFAHITTIDAFNLYLAKKYHNYIGIDDIDIIEDSILKLYEKRYIQEELDDLYKTNNQILSDFIELFCKKNDNLIYEIISKIINFCDISLKSEGFFIRFNNIDFINNCYLDICDTTFEYIKNKYEDLKSVLNKLSSYPDNVYDDYLKCFNSINITSFDNFIYNIKDIKSPRIKGGELKEDEYYFSLHYEFQGKLNNLKKTYKIFSLSNKEKELITSNYDFTKLLINIAKSVIAKIEEFKKIHNCYTYNDIAKFVIRILDNKKANKLIKEEFKYIMIDEYQDTSDIQEEIIKRLENNNTFMVGDVKQSIYKFRNANCEIFLDKYKQYKTTGSGTSIDMTLNFRSREELLKDVNNIFNKLMDKNNNIIDYQDGHISYYGNKKYDNKQKGYTYGLSALVYEKEKESKDNYEKEIRFIASDIKQKLKDNLQIYDLKSNCFRNAVFSDFAILIDRGSRVDVIEKIFDEYKLPYYKNLDDDLSENDVFAIIKNLLILIYQSATSNTDDKTFKHAFVSIARSYLFEYSDEKIYYLIKDNTYLKNPIILKINQLSKNIDCLSLYETTTMLINEFDLLNKLNLVGDFQSAHATINMILDKIKVLDNFSYDLNELIQFFDDLKQEQISLRGSDIKLDDNVITITNYHKCKGLEYTICYYPFLFVGFNRSDIYSMNFSKDYGYVSNNYFDTKKSLLLRHVKDVEIQKDFEEKLRLLYVAITRAKEMAILVLQIPDKIKEDVTKSICFSDMLYYVYDLIKNKKEVSEEDIENIQLKTSQIKENKQFTLYDPIKIKSKQINISHASKDITSDIDEEKLLFGDRLHHILQAVDLHTKDTSFIKDAKIKSIIDKVLDNELFDNLNNCKILKEFSFNDKINNINGIIDCMIIKDDEVIIIDYKTRQINDEAYKKQLNIYASYVKQLTNKKIKLYLLSIIDNRFKEVEVGDKTISV